MNLKFALDDFALRCFRDTADADYLMARAAFRYQLAPQALWASMQVVEKYLKCILLLNRVEGAKVGHSLSKGLKVLVDSKKIDLNLSSASQEFIDHIDRFGECRYLEISVVTYGRQIVDLDRVVWELRRFCAPEEYGQVGDRGSAAGSKKVRLHELLLREGAIPERYLLRNGFLEKIIDDDKHPGRAMLVWQNGFLGKRLRRSVRHRGGFDAVNSPLFNHPDIIQEVRKYVHVPKDLVQAYEKLQSEKRT
ncbi:MAG: hypothetical protein ABL970_16870 [Nitrospira sp.]